MTEKSLYAEALAIEGTLVRLRRQIHEQPELAFEERKTAALVAERLEALGLEPVTGLAETAVLARIEGGRATGAPAVALRADMDALPIDEAGDAPIRSRVPGCAHLCGHDAHTAILLGAAEILCARRESLARPVLLVFQPAEEVTDGGASRLVAAGALEGVAEIYGLHVNPDLPVGTLGLRAGATMAAMDRFEVAVLGRGGHGAMPHHARDPVAAAAAVIQALQGVVARRLDPVEHTVISVCSVHGGSAFNAIPDRVDLGGTARTISAPTREAVEALIAEVASSAAAGLGCTAETRYVRGTPVLVNDARAAERTARLWRSEGGPGAQVADIRPTMGGEDFAYYLEHVPGCFAFLGAAPEAPDDRAGSFHNPAFRIHEACLARGAALLAALALAEPLAG